MRNLPPRQPMFANEWVRPLFEHLRNLLVCVAILAAGAFTAESPPDNSWLTPLSEYTGWFAIGIGTLLMLLNLADGYYRLSRLKHHRLLHVLMVCFVLGQYVSTRQYTSASRVERSGWVTCVTD